MTDETPAYLLEHHLAELPVLHDLLLKHEGDLLAHGERGSDHAPLAHYPADLDVIDLANDRPKWLRDYSGPESDDQAERARFARLVCGGQRRHGVLQELAGWVRLADGEMHDAGVTHVLPAEHPTVATEAGWLAAHIDWLVRQPWADELATDLAALARDLRALVGDRPLDDHLVWGTATHCGHLLGIPASTIRSWAARGLLAPVRSDRRGLPVYLIADVAAARR